MPGRTLLTSILAASLCTGSLPAQGGAPAYDGAAATGLALRALGHTGRVLHIAAHPDDENTALISTLVLGHGADVAYLSLTRGEGGQNSIGPELGTALGIVRGEELVSARRLDGGRQFFARAIDYGYSKNADEAFRRWPRDELLADVVEVIRRYRPDVVVSVWSGTELDGHGQHQASGVVAREAVLAAGDPARFPDQVAAGLRPHRAALYYRAAFFSDREPDAELDSGRLDPLLGLSYQQIAMASRSLHRSQDQGRPLTPGPGRTSFHRVDPAADEPVAASRQFGRYSEGPPAADRPLFAGVDTLLSQRADRAAARADGDRRRALERAADRFRAYEALVAGARRDFNALEPWRLLPALARARALLDDADDGLEDDPAAADLRFHLAGERADLRDALLGAANVRADVVADHEWVVPGQSFRLELGVWNGGPAPVRARMAPRLPAGWTAAPIADGAAASAVNGEAAGRAAGKAGPNGEVTVAPGDRTVVAFRIAIPDDAAYTMPYYLDPRDPVDGAMYRWPDDPAVRALPAAPAAVRGAFRIRLDDGTPLDLERDAARVLVDRRAGEVRRPVKVVPRASLAVEPGLVLLPLADAAAGRAAREVAVRVRAHGADSVAGDLVLDAPPGWEVRPARVPVELAGGAERAVAFDVTPPAGLDAGEHELRAVLDTDRGRHDLDFQVIDYPHIEPTHLYRVARVRARALDLEVAPVRVGYIAAAGDAVPAALDRMGVDWEPVTARHLANGELRGFDVVVVGARAYELRPDLVAHNDRLLDWVRDGGTLIVQYQQYTAVRDGFAPWPVTIARPHGRVTDEAAAVTVLEPGHPVFDRPNPIGPADWDGWVQERGLYFLDSWDGPLTPLLAMSDPGEDLLTGALLTAPLGRGTWVYTGLALFRQLPEGVPGAYRLLANLLSLGAGP